MLTRMDELSVSLCRSVALSPALLSLVAAPKTFTRMDNKRMSDYSNPEVYPFPTAMHNKDPLRKSIRSAGDVEQIAARRFRQHIFSPLRPFLTHFSSARPVTHAM